MKRLTILIVATWLMLGLAILHTATADEPCTMYVHVREGTFLNGRLAPNMDSEIMMYLGRSYDVTVLQVKNGWALIEGGEAGTCWCCVDYLADYAPDDEAPLYTVEANGRVRVRRTPGGATVRYVHDGDTVEVRFLFDGWAYIGDGYVMAEYLTPNKFGFMEGRSLP